MAIDNQFRINELITSGSRAVISKDEVSGTHTFITNSKVQLDSPYPHLRGERDGEFVGRIEKPKYNEDQLKKSVDTDVDELISPPRRIQPEVVPKPVYDDLLRRYNQALLDLSNANIRIAQLESQVQTLSAEIEALLVENDSLKVKTAIAENEAQVSNERYVGLLSDFSNAIIKGTRDAIERVSLQAQNQGLQAQKESLRQLLIQTQAQLELTRSQVEQEQLRQAASEALDGVPGTFNQLTKTGWKIPQTEITKQDKQLYIEVYQVNNRNDIRAFQGSAINLFNFDSEQEQTFTARIVGRATEFLKVGSPITLPVREGNQPGKGYIGLEWGPLGRTNKRKEEFGGSVEITATPSGETFSIPAVYFKEARRADDPFRRGSTRSVVGQEIS